MRLEFEPNVTAFPLVENEFFDYPQTPDAAILLKKGIAAAQNGERDQARELLAEASKQDPQSEDAWMWQASVSDYPEELLAFLDRVLVINPENERAAQWRTQTKSLLAKTFVQRAVAAHEEGSADMAARCLDQAIGYDYNCEMAWFWKASIATSTDDKLECLRNVLEINPVNQDARDAVEAVRRPSLLESFEEAKSAAVAGKRNRALKLVDEFLLSVPDNAEAWILRSHLSLGIDEKIKSLEKALEIDPDNAGAKSNHAFLLATVGSAIEEPVSASRIVVIQPAVSPVENTWSDEFVAENVPDDRDVESFAGPLADADPAVETVESLTPFEQKVVEEVVVNLDFRDGNRAPTPETRYEFEDLPSFANPVEAIDAAYDATFDDGPDYAVEEPAELSTSAPEYFAEDEAEFPPAEQQYAAEDQAELSPAAPEYFAEDAAEFSPAEQQYAAEDQAELSPAAPEYFADDQAELSPVEPQYASEDRTELPPAAPEYIAEDFAEPPAEPEVMGFACPYCAVVNEVHAFECVSCRAGLTLSDIESLLANSRADHGSVQQAVTQMEAEWNLREFSVDELTTLAIGHFNLGNFGLGMKYLREASSLNPNNVILAGHVNTLAIRLDEMRRQDENHEGMAKGKTILVVDDSPTVRKLISGKLEKSGHTVVCAVDGVEAMERIGTSLPDLVLLDITMPRKDGYEVCKEIRANPAAADLPVVMISGKDGFFDKVRGRMAGATGYVTKPFGPETLMKALETYLLPESEDEPGPPTARPGS